MSFSWAALGHDLADVAPIIGGALLGPAGAAVGALIADTLGTAHDAGAVKAALAADPSALAKVRELEIHKGLEIAKLAAKAQLAQIGLEKEQVQADVEEAKSGWAGDWRDAVGWVCVAAFAWAYIGLPLARFGLHLAHSTIHLGIPDLTVLEPILIGMLGLGGLKTGERIVRGR